MTRPQARMFPARQGSAAIRTAPRTAPLVEQPCDYQLVDETPEESALVRRKESA